MWSINSKFVQPNKSLNINACTEKSRNFTDICDQPFVKFSVIDIFEALNSFDLNPYPGPNGLPNILLRSCLYSISDPICKIYNRSLAAGIFLLSGKIALPYQFINLVIII